MEFQRTQKITLPEDRFRGGEDKCRKIYLSPMSRAENKNLWGCFPTDFYSRWSDRDSEAALGGLGSTDP